jgi:hypothetical protein
LTRLLFCLSCAFARAFRDWAVAQLDRYQLLYGPSLAGYDAHAERLIAAGQASAGRSTLAAPTRRRSIRQLPT